MVRDLLRPPKWHPFSTTPPPPTHPTPLPKKPFMVTGDLYTLPEHFLNLSSVFFRHKRISSLFHPRFKAPSLSHALTPSFSTRTLQNYYFLASAEQRGALRLCVLCSLMTFETIPTTQHLMCLLPPLSFYTFIAVHIISIVALLLP